MIELDDWRRRRSAVDRRADRLVAVIAVSMAIAFMVAAAVAAFLPVTVRVGAWLPLHLALAGGASTAIAGLMPFFAAAIATTQPASARVRWGSIGAVSVGGAAAATGYAAAAALLAVVGGLLFLAGMALVSYATVTPLARALGPKGGIVTLGYALALLLVMTGALLATLFLAGWPPVLSAWAALKPAHAWLNLVGFVSLVIATTLLHFFPTVVGARIPRSPTARLTVLGLAGGTVLVALGFALGSDWLVRGGAIGVLVGATALLAYAWLAWRGRARWTGDGGWHRFTSGGLACGLAWFAVGMLLATTRLLVAGAAPGSSSVDILLAPLVIGWVGLSVLASATHLVPAIGPGDPAAHAAQRRLLGRGAAMRLVAANAGVVVLAIGVPLRLDPLVVAGVVLAASSLVWTGLLVVAAVGHGMRSARLGGNLGI